MSRSADTLDNGRGGQRMVLKANTSRRYPNITKLQTLIPYEVFEKRNLYGFINQNGEWVKNGNLIIKKEWVDNHEYKECISLKQKLSKFDEDLNWLECEEAMVSERYILNQLNESHKRGEGWIYKLPIDPYNYYKFDRTLTSYCITLTNDGIADFAKEDGEFRDLYLDLIKASGKLEL